MKTNNRSSSLFQSQSSSLSTMVAKQVFPVRLYRMLQDSKPRGFEEIVGWLDAKHFRVFDRERFETLVLPLYFESTKFKSFRRQLNFYHFDCIRDAGSPLKGSYTHPDFHRDHPNLELIYLRRISPSTTTTTPASPKVSVPVSPSTSQEQGLDRWSSEDSFVLVPQDEHATIDDEPLDSNGGGALDTEAWPLIEEVNVVTIPSPTTKKEQEVDEILETYLPVAASAAAVPATPTTLTPQGRILVDWASTVPEDIQCEILATFVLGRSDSPAAAQASCAV